MDVDIVTPDASQNTNEDEQKSQDPESLKIQSNKPKRRAGAKSNEPEEGEPGYAWSNPKARAEFDRAMEMVQDREFSLSKHVIIPLRAPMIEGDLGEFGDPLLKDQSATKD